MFRLNIGFRVWPSGKLLFTMPRKIRPTLFFTFKSNGGLYHVICLGLVLHLSLLLLFESGLYFS